MSSVHPASLGSARISHCPVCRSERIKDRIPHFGYSSNSKVPETDTAAGAVIRNPRNLLVVGSHSISRPNGNCTITPEVGEMRNSQIRVRTVGSDVHVCAAVASHVSTRPRSCGGVIVVELVP